MIVPASGHQVRCIPWVQMGTFNKEIGCLCGLKFFASDIFCENTYNRVYIWCCKYGENRHCERCANKWWCASKHTGLLNSCLGKCYVLPYLVVPLISTRVTLISTRVSAHCQAFLFMYTLFAIMIKSHFGHRFISYSKPYIQFCFPKIFGSFS